jgi:ABC-type Zn2+ transport system substrate-binding protein/surface adhesin
MPSVTPRSLRRLHWVMIPGWLVYREDKIMEKLKKRIAELAKQNTQLADHLANVLRKPGNMQAIDDAYDYLKKIGYLK